MCVFGVKVSVLWVGEVTDPSLLRAMVFIMLFLGSISLRYLGDVGVEGTESEAEDDEEAEEP